MLRASAWGRPVFRWDVSLGTNPTVAPRRVSPPMREGDAERVPTRARGRSIRAVPRGVQHQGEEQKREVAAAAEEPVTGGLELLAHAHARS